MFAKINFHDEFYQKLKLLVLPITMQQFMLALVSATDAIMLGAVSQTSLSAVSLAGQIQFVLNLFISGICRFGNHGSTVLGEKGRGFH